MQVSVNGRRLIVSEHLHTYIVDWLSPVLQEKWATIFDKLFQVNFKCSLHKYFHIVQIYSVNAIVSGVTVHDISHSRIRTHGERKCSVGNVQAEA